MAYAYTDENSGYVAAPVGAEKAVPGPKSRKNRTFAGLPRYYGQHVKLIDVAGVEPDGAQTIAFCHIVDTRCSSGLCRIKKITVRLRDTAQELADTYAKMGIEAEVRISLRAAIVRGASKVLASIKF